MMSWQSWLADVTTRPCTGPKPSLVIILSYAFLVLLQVYVSKIVHWGPKQEMGHLTALWTSQAFQEMQVHKTDQMHHMEQGLSITWYVYSISWSLLTSQTLTPWWGHAIYKSTALAHWNENALCGILQKSEVHFKLDWHFRNSHTHTSILAPRHKTHLD